MSQVRILIVDDSPMAQSLIRTILETDPEISVVGVAADGVEAVQMNADLRPDLVTMDITMPRMNGFQAIERIMATQPTPILVITSSKEAGTAFKSLSHGALDVIEKPELEENFRSSNFEDFNRRVKMIARVKVVTHISGKSRRFELVVPSSSQRKVVAMVSSTGGPKALAGILGSLPESLAAPVLIVQHMADGFMEGLVSWLQNISSMRVKLAEPGESLDPGTVYVAPHGRHLVVNNKMRLDAAVQDPGEGHCPSGNRLFSSLAQVAGPRCMGVVLTGMGQDGALGLKDLRAAGGKTIVQDEESCLIFGMPKAAMENGAAERSVPLDAIPDEIVAYAGLLNKTKRSRQSI